MMLLLKESLKIFVPVAFLSFCTFNNETHFCEFVPSHYRILVIFSNLV
jgi:hypothetical protein